MKILNAIHAQTIGGVDQVFRNYNDVLSANGHEIALLISKNGYENYTISKIFKLRNFAQIFDFIHFLLVIILFKPDIILCHSNRIMKWTRFLKFFSSAKSVAINHGISFKNSLHCDFIININNEIYNSVLEKGFNRKKTFILPNVIKINQNFHKKTLKHPPVIAIYGRIEPRKGFDILIQACAILAKNNQDFILKIGGFEVPGDYSWNTLKNLAKEHNIFAKCQFVGTVLDKKSFFENVDIFCVPSREEPFGLVILEGFLFSTLVISSDSDGGKFLIKNGKNGLLFKNENINDLAQQIEGLLNNPENYSKITNEAFLQLEAKFSFDFLSQEIEKILTPIKKAKK